MKQKKLLFIIIAVIIGLIGILYISAYITYNKHDKSINESIENLSELFSKHINSKDFDDIIIINNDISLLLKDYGDKIENLKNNTLSKTFFAKKIEESDNLYTHKDSKYSKHIGDVNLLIENLSEDNENHRIFIDKYTNLDKNIKSEINNQSPVKQLQEYKHSVSAQKQLALNNIPLINQKISKSLFEGNYEKMRVGVLTNFHSELTIAKLELQTIGNNLDNAIKLYHNHSTYLNNMSRQLIGQSQGLNEIYQNISPMSRNIQSYVQPVNEAIKVIERPIIRTGPLGRDVSALSLINLVDPMTGSTIMGVQDFCQLILNMTNEIEKIGQIIEPLNRSANEYIRNPNRQNAIALNESAINTKNYLNDKKSMFDPVSQKISETRSLIDSFNRSVSSVRNNRARDLLYSFTRSANLMLNYTESPIRVWQNNIDYTNSQFKSINKWEKEYTSAINNILN